MRGNSNGSMSGIRLGTRLGAILGLLLGVASSMQAEPIPDPVLRVIPPSATTIVHIPKPKLLADVLERIVQRSAMRHPLEAVDQLQRQRAAAGLPLRPDRVIPGPWNVSDLESVEAKILDELLGKTYFARSPRSIWDRTVAAWSAMLSAEGIAELGTIESMTFFRVPTPSAALRTTIPVPPPQRVVVIRTSNSRLLEWLAFSSVSNEFSLDQEEPIGPFRIFTWMSFQEPGFERRSRKSRERWGAFQFRPSVRTVRAGFAVAPGWLVFGSNPTIVKQLVRQLPPVNAAPPANVANAANAHPAIANFDADWPTIWHRIGGKQTIHLTMQPTIQQLRIRGTINHSHSLIQLGKWLGVRMDANRSSIRLDSTIPNFDTILINRLNRWVFQAIQQGYRVAIPGTWVIPEAAKPIRADWNALRLIPPQATAIVHLPKPKSTLAAIDSWLSNSPLRKPWESISPTVKAVMDIHKQRWINQLPWQIGSSLNPLEYRAEIDHINLMDLGGLFFIAMPDRFELPYSLLVGMVSRDMLADLGKLDSLTVFRMPKTATAPARHTAIVRLGQSTILPLLIRSRILSDPHLQTHPKIGAFSIVSVELSDAKLNPLRDLKPNFGLNESRILKVDDEPAPTKQPKEIPTRLTYALAPGCLLVGDDRLTIETLARQISDARAPTQPPHPITALLHPQHPTVWMAAEARIAFAATLPSIATENSAFDSFAEFLLANRGEADLRMELQLDPDTLTLQIQATGTATTPPRQATWADVPGTAQGRMSWKSLVPVPPIRPYSDSWVDYWNPAYQPPPNTDPKLLNQLRTDETFSLYIERGRLINRIGWKRRFDIFQAIRNQPDWQWQAKQLPNEIQASIRFSGMNPLASHALDWVIFRTSNEFNLFWVDIPVVWFDITTEEPKFFDLFESMEP
ncbi:hypothetical protein [Tuwongella immobilis]|uniref:Uncharacterized protein n=1 Tax=Tuwongella immobilis TaxID=692036 RepID=A0A6C2YVZ4_9BACT|nr:hypothetical protein [Tuwongella immobilis]VIP05686.1 unnamed protein product [Tuwongella immobilis]VTS08728.1 unnamed protein product [Tuwongella immobilis]